MDVINNNLRRNNFILYKQDHEESVWKVLKKYYKDFEKLEFDGEEYILLMSDCKNYIEIIINDVGCDYSIGLSSCDDACSSIDSYNSDSDSDWNELI